MRTLVFLAVIAALAVGLSAKPMGITESPVADNDETKSPIVRRMISLRKDLTQVMHKFEKDHKVAVHGFNINMIMDNPDQEKKIIENDPNWNPGSSDIKTYYNRNMNPIFREGDVDTQTAESIYRKLKDFENRDSIEDHI